MNALTRAGIWLVVCAQVAFDVWVVARSSERPRKEARAEARYATQIYRGWVYRTEPRTGLVEMFNPVTRIWVPLGTPALVPPGEENDPRYWGAMPVEP